jgi:hypothetical protein
MYEIEVGNREVGNRQKLLVVEVGPENICRAIDWMLEIDQIIQLKTWARNWYNVDDIDHIVVINAVVYNDKGGCDWKIQEILVYDKDANALPLFQSAPNVEMNFQTSKRYCKLPAEEQVFSNKEFYDWFADWTLDHWWDSVYSSGIRPDMPGVYHFKTEAPTTRFFYTVEANVE